MRILVQERSAGHAVCTIFFFLGSGDHRDLHSFPTRRSSDLRRSRAGEPVERVPQRADFEPPRIRSVGAARSEEHTSELQSHSDLVCRLLLEKKKDGNDTLEREDLGVRSGVRLAPRNLTIAII